VVLKTSMKMWGYAPKKKKLGDYILWLLRFSTQTLH